MNGPLSPSQYQTLLADVSQLVAQLRAGEPADFGRLARRLSDSGERIVELLWREREALKSEYCPNFEPAQAELTFIRQESTQWVKGWMVWAYDQNQFFELDARGNQAMLRAHEQLIRCILRSQRDSASPIDFSRSAHMAWVRYAERLSRVFRNLVAPGGMRGRGAEYSAELQLKILGLTDHQWVEPIVDLGCGIEANVVQQLRTLGLNATGLERRSAAPFVLESDWFAVRFEPNSIGTIISHLAFSLQFLHHHWHPGDRAYAYARKYIELVKSLVSGGVFCYAPGLPFIETMLDPSEYQIQTIPLPEPLATTMESFRDIGTGKSVAYSCQIRRR